jgi:hypothetical protein
VARVRLVHWNEEEVPERAARIAAAGHSVDAAPLRSAADLKPLRADPPDAVVIDLTRLPSQGRDIALALRSSPKTRRVPLVFVGGEPAKVERTRALLPDATYASWRGVRGALKRALARPVVDPVVPGSNLAGYSGTPLPKKLGIKPGFTVALVGAPADFEKTLGALPADVTLRRHARGRSDLTVWFPKSRADLERRVGRLGQAAGDGGIWIAWPKQASGVKTDLTQAGVRAAGLANGLVDYKICAIDATWSALRFARRR